MFSSLKKLRDSGLSREELEKKVAELRLPMPLALFADFCIPLIILLVWTVPTAIAAIPFIFLQNEYEKIFAVCLAPIIFGLSFVFLAGLLSQIGQYGIIVGKFPRHPHHPVYAMRRIYGATWTQLYYFKPLYAVLLSVQLFKSFTFKIFGLKGDVDLTIYPDSWIRDLPLLSFGKGVYIANRATLGSNICMIDGSIIVDRMYFGDRTLVGHMVLIALGTRVGIASEFGINAACGIRVLVGDEVSVRPRSNLNHGCKIGNKSVIGTGALVGLKAEIGPNIEIRSGASIPPGVIIRTQEEADLYFSSETQRLNDERDTVLSKIEELRYGTSHGNGQ